jgi:protoporphyrinogen oxidase
MKRWEELSRRDLFKITGGGLTLLIAGCSSSKKLAPQSPEESKKLNAFIKEFGPVDRTVDHSKPQTTFSGDDNRRPHQILWDVEGYLKNKKVEFKEETNVVIVGGGASGLISAYQFKEYQPIVLEQAKRFGGNAKGESWKGLDYALGSAYLDAPHKGTPMEYYFKEFGFNDLAVRRQDADPVEVNGKLYRGFWEGETEPALKAKYEKLHHLFESMNLEKERPFPFIPSLTNEHLESVKYYDQWSLHEFLTKYLEGIPQHLETALEHYCYSTYAATAKEISAAAALNFLAQEMEPICPAPGGNACYAERVLNRLLEYVPSENLRASSIVVRVKVEGDSSYVYYEDHKGQLHEIKAKAVIMCCPKFVVKNILQDIENDRLEAISNIKFRSYMTANLLLKKVPEEKFYDLFMVDEGKLKSKNPEKHSELMDATDIILANFASPEHKDYSVLTFYRAFPHDNARSELYKTGSYEKQKAKLERQINKKILPMLKLSKADVVGLRLTLWGHALPISYKGVYRSGDIDILRRPFKEKVFFVEQDNWSYPSFQTGATEVALLKKQIEQILDG